MFVIFSFYSSRAKVFYSVMIIQSLREIFVEMPKSMARYEITCDTIYETCLGPFSRFPKPCLSIGFIEAGLHNQRFRNHNFAWVNSAF